MPKIKGRAQAMEEMEDYKIRPEEHMHRDGLLLRKEDLTEDMRVKDAKNTIYYLFSYAHGMTMNYLDMLGLTKTSECFADTSEVSSTWMGCYRGWVHS